jgi:ubiquinone/menaquinone biosynthesis C-methylase UbiE
MTDDVYKRKSRAAYDRYAPRYDTDVSGRHARWLQPAVLAALEEIEFAAVLDVGCGTGALLEKILAARPTSAAHGIDLSPGMIAVACERLGDSADLRVADAEALPLADDSVDVVICVDSFHHYPRPDVALGEMRRVLRAGGTLVVGEWRVPAPLRRLMNAIIGKMPDGDVRIYSRAEIEALAQTSGFAVTHWSEAGRRAQLLVCRRPDTHVRAASGREMRQDRSDLKESIG